MDVSKMTFNDIPDIMSRMYKKIERVESMLDSMRNELDQNKNGGKVEHTPMTLDEACEFLRMKKSTMYYKLEKGHIPATKMGKNYILYKDELVRWTESGRVNNLPLSFDEQNEAILKSHKRKPNRH